MQMTSFYTDGEVSDSRKAERERVAYYDEVARILATGNTVKVIVVRENGSKTEYVKDGA